MWIRDLDRDELVALAQRTYEKEDWSPDDIRTLRICWEEFEKRGGLNPVMFFRPAYWGVLKFHEIDSGEVDEQFVQMLERTGAAIAPDYREVMRKLAHAAGSSPPCCSGGAIGGSLQESFRPISRTFRPIHRAAFRSQAAICCSKKSHNDCKKSTFAARRNYEKCMPDQKLSEFSSHGK